MYLILSESSLKLWGFFPADSSALCLVVLVWSLSRVRPSGWSDAVLQETFALSCRLLPSHYRISSHQWREERADSSITEVLWIQYEDITVQLGLWWCGTLIYFSWSWKERREQRTEGWQFLDTHDQASIYKIGKGGVHQYWVCCHIHDQCILDTGHRHKHTSVMQKDGREKGKEEKIRQAKCIFLILFIPHIKTIEIGEVNDNDTCCKSYFKVLSH